MCLEQIYDCCTHVKNRHLQEHTRTFDSADHDGAVICSAQDDSFLLGTLTRNLPS